MNAAPNDTTIGHRIDAVIDAAIAERRLVGAVVLVARDGECVHSRAAGFADRESARPMREDSIFRLSSLTKPLVTAAAMRAVERGTLDLAAPVTDILPEFTPALPDGTRPSISIEQLLTHQAGLGYSFLEPVDSAFNALGISSGLDHPGLSMRDNIARLARAPLVFAPGTQWRYSIGIDVIGAVLEATTGRRLDDIVAADITTPLGITDTGFAPPDRARLATPYVARITGEEPVAMGRRCEIRLGDAMLVFEPERAFDPASFASGGAGMNGTAPDMLRFFEAIRTGGAPILQPATLTAMTTPRPGVQTTNPGWGFGLGWAVLLDPVAAATPQNPGTLQWGGVYGHKWFIDPVARLSVVSLTNTAPEDMDQRFANDLRDAIYGP